MAFQGSRIPNRLKKQPFKPLAPGVKNQYQLRKAIQRRTEGTIRPKLRAVNEQGTQEGLAHAGRSRDLQGYYDYYGGQVQDAYNKALDAANNLMAQTAGANTTSQQNLLAALESSRAGDRQQASTVGGVLPEGLGDDVAAMAAGAGNASLANLGNTLGQGVGAAADRIGLAGLGRTRALEAEQGRYGAIRKELQKKRGGIKEEIPAAREEARKNVLDEELARATERNRENIARGSLNLEKRKTKEEERSNRANEGIAREQNDISWAGIRNERQKIDREVELAGSEADKEAAEARGEAYNRGVEIFQRYFDNTKKKAWNPQTLYRNLTLAVSPELAKKIMSHGPKPFQKFAGGGSGPKNSQGPYKGNKPGLGK